MASTGLRGHPDRFLPPDPRVEEPYRFTPQRGLRVAVLGVLALGIFAVLFLRLWALQVLAGTRYLHQAQNNQLRSVPLEAPRGPILDRNGRILVTNVAGTKALLWPNDMPKQRGRDTEVRRLAAILRIPRGEILAKIKEHAQDPLTPITLQVAVHKEQVDYILEHGDEFRGVKIVQTYLRRYKSEALASQLLGYDGRISPVQLKDLRKQGYKPDDVIGQAGVEATYDQSIRGKTGIQVLSVDSLGRPRGGFIKRQDAQPGYALRLTIDISLQRAAERAIRYGIELARKDGHWAANGGAIVALDPRDGSVLALASNPTYRPGVWVGRVDPKAVAPLIDLEAAKKANYPGLDRAIQGTYPAGSTFKPVTALAAMETKLVTPYQTLQCTPLYVVHGATGAGQTFKNWDPYRNQPMTMTEALAASCDTYFYQLGYQIYGLPSSYGHPLQNWAGRFGFGQRTGIDIGPENPGLLPTPAWRQQTFTKKTDPLHWQEDSLWKPGDSIQLAIGQKDLLVTPMQLARFYALIATGKLVTPHVAEDIEVPGNGHVGAKVLRRFTPPARSSGVDPNILSVVRQGLLDATHSTEGTATAVFGTFKVPIAGKTGTAEKIVPLPGYPAGHSEDQSLFCGYGPANAPEIVVCSLIENGGHGGTAAAPAALKVFEQYFHQRAGQLGSVYSD